MENSQIEIFAEIDKKVLGEEKHKVLKKISKDIEIQGFRKGQAPQKLVVEKVGEMAILEEAAELLIGGAYAEIINEHKLKPIGRPEVTITKLASDNNLEFKIKTAVIPEVNLGSYADIAKDKVKNKIPDPEISEKELQDILIQIKKENSGKMPQGQNKIPESNVETSDLVNPVRSPREALNPTFAKTDQHSSPQQAAERSASNGVNDEFARSLGFKDLDELKDRVIIDFKKAKIEKEKSKIRMDILEEIVKDSTIDLPQIIIESELKDMFGRFRDEIESAGLNFKDYLSKTNSSEEKVMLEWKPQAEKKAKIQLILNKIAEEQNIKAPEMRVESEVERIIKQYPDADRQRAQILVETMLLNEAVFEFLENIK